jgi:3-phenylpropionate/trans-cinnamate dioxygenase ferredoxin subunit
VSEEVARVGAEAVRSGAALGLEGGICLVRVGESYYALEDRCSHENVPLSEGEVDTDELTIECWKHGSTFSILDGSAQCLPAIRPVAVYRVERDGEDVVVIRP